MAFLQKQLLFPFAIQLALLLSRASADIVVDWHYYPAASQTCLNNAQNAVKCPSGDVPSFNGCVCRNGNGFLQNAAQCLGSSDSGDLNGVYSVLVTNCGNSQTPVSISLSQWLAWAGSNTPTPPPVVVTTPPPVVVTTPPPVVVTTPPVVVVTAPPVVVTPPTKVLTQQATVVTQPPVVVTQSAAVVTQQGSVVTQQATVFTQPGTTLTQSATVITQLGTAVTQSTSTHVSGTGGTGGGSVSASSQTPSPVGKSKLGTGAIIGLGVGIPGCAAVIGLLALVLLRGRRDKDDYGRRVEGALPRDGSHGASAATGVVEHYKDRPESIPSTVSPIPDGGYSPGQGDVRYSIPPPAFIPPAHMGPVTHPGQQPYPGQQYYPQYPRVGEQYVVPTSMADHQVPGTFSELSSGHDAQMMGSPMPQPRTGGYHELPSPD
jgi:hypothetical protein